MKVLKIDDMIGGWFIGNFEPTAYKTDQFEVSYKLHPKGQRWDVHYHTDVTEINYVIRGEMTIQGKLLSSGDIFILEPYEIADPEFLIDTEIICVKTPSLNDKISVILK
jgi:mannose-6-phosphate isomerase-like protein (cupin superfamily)